MNGDLALYNGTIYTMDPARPRADALLAAGGRIVCVGSNADVRERAGRFAAVEAVDLRGACVVPGFTDSHIHFVSYGLNLERVDLAGAASLEQVLDRVRPAAAALPPGTWLQGWGWDHSLWEVARFPDKTALDRVAPDRPVALRRKDGHMFWLNSAALLAAGITRQTEDVPGGRIGRDAAGEPNGLLFENAMELAYQAIPDDDEAQLERAVRRAQAELHRLGVTGIHVPEGAAEFRALQGVERAGDLRLRVTMMLAAEGLDGALATGLATGFGSERLRVGPLKLFADGSLGSETAAMLEPFEQSTDRGILTMPVEAIPAQVERAARGGVACAIHAIGDLANRVVLDALEATAGIWRPRGLRQRIEHAQVLHPEDLPRFAATGVIASVQPIHATQDMDAVDRLWGRRGRYAYAFKSLHDSGARLAFGSDAPVETPDPLHGLYAAVARRRLDGRPADGWYPEERLSVEQALAAYTTGAAYAAGTERQAGSLTAGKWADLVSLSEDPLAGGSEAVGRARVTRTVFAGQVVFSA